MEANRCTSTRRDGEPCQAPALPGATLCWAHHPDVQEKRREGQRRGGHAKSNAARAAKLWAAVGRQIPDEALPDLLKAAILDVREGRLEPAQASAIANLAKTAVAITVEIDHERRIEALEAAAAHQAPQPFRKVS